MNRMEEYHALMAELDQSVPALETTLDRACRKKRKRTAKMILRPIAGLAACFAIFVLLVNFCAPVAYACSLVPGLRELAEAVTFSNSLSDAVENEYVQPMELTQTKAGITAEIAYLIVDQKQVNVFYRLDSEIYTKLDADTDILTADSDRPASCSWTNMGYGQENGELRNLSIDFLDQNVPDHLRIKLKVSSNDAIDEMAAPVDSVDSMFGDVSYDPEYIAEFDFLLEFDPKFTATGKVFPVNQTVELDGQKITITDIEVYPTHMRVDIADAKDNTAWLERLDFYIETDWGMRFDPASNGITAVGSGEDDSKSMVSYRADSTYFYEAEHLKLVITGAKWLNKDMEKTYLNLKTGETGPLPEGAEFVSAEKVGSEWLVTFKAVYYEDKPLYQLFSNTFYDAEGTKYEINTWSSTYCDPDGNGNITHFEEKFPLRNYPYDEVWLTPAYSHEWVAEDLIIVTIQ